MRLHAFGQQNRHRRIADKHPAPDSDSGALTVKDQRCNGQTVEFGFAFVTPFWAIIDSKWSSLAITSFPCSVNVR